MSTTTMSTTTMSTRTSRPLIFLLSAVVSADAAPGGRPSSAKLRMMDRVLMRRLPELDAKARWEVVSEALSGVPELSGGIRILELVERQAGKLGRQLGDKPARAHLVLKYLISIAEADDEITLQEERIISTVARALGAADALTVGEDAWGDITLAVAA